MSSVTLLPKQAAEQVGHDEQLQVWAHDIAVRLGMENHLSLTSHDEILDVERIIRDELKTILQSAFDHPEAVTTLRKRSE